jgi:hypothetical protein
VQAAASGNRGCICAHQCRSILSVRHRGLMWNSGRDYDDDGMALARESRRVCPMTVIHTLLGRTRQTVLLIASISKTKET